MPWLVVLRQILLLIFIVLFILFLIVIFLLILLRSLGIPHRYPVKSKIDGSLAVEVGGAISCLTNPNPGDL